MSRLLWDQVAPVDPALGIAPFDPSSDEFSEDEDYDFEGGTTTLESSMDKPPPYPGSEEPDDSDRDDAVAKEPEDPDAVLDENWELGLDDDDIGDDGSEDEEEEEEKENRRRIAEKND